MNNNINNSREILCRKTPLCIVNFTTVLILSLIVLIIISNFSYNKYLQIYGYVVLDNNDYYINTYLSKTDIANLQKFKLYLDNKKTNFKVIKISNEQYYIDNKSYYLVSLKINLDKSQIIQNNIINLMFKIRKTTLKKEIFIKIKEVIYDRND